MRLFYKNIFIVIIFLPFSISALAASSPNYDLNQTVINAFGNTYSGSGKKLHDSAGEGIVGQIFSATYSIQSGFFNTYYMLPLSPTPTPTITITATPTYTPTVIRGFGGEIGLGFDQGSGDIAVDGNRSVRRDLDPGLD